ncbi:conserved hypothetical protein [Tenacibaculum sediminilitoris]|uniref:hypothetical protein n=1 Tax=Tenacibaculum sediminilitoris TaxID=1820334 RepID=UPI003894F173
MKYNSLKYGTIYAAIEFTFDADGSECINYLKLHKKKNELAVIESTSFIKVDELLTFIKDTLLPTCIVFNNKNVITKLVSLTSLLGRKNEVIQSVFPNISTDDFFYEVYKGEEKGLVSIARKDYINKVLALFVGTKINIVAFYLGNGIVKNISSYISKETIYTSNSKITFKGEEFLSIEDYKESNEKYDVNGVELSSRNLLAFSAILDSFFNVLTSIEANKETCVKALKEEFVKKRMFSKGLLISLIFLLVLFLINFFFFSHYNTEIQKVESELSLLKDNKNFIEELKVKTEDKAAIINNFNSVLESKISWYVDEISLRVPDNILLKEITFQPLQKSIKKEKEILYEEDVFVIEGEAIDSYEISKWVDDLAKIKWIDDVIVNDLENKTARKNSFTLFITITNEKE